MKWIGTKKELPKNNQDILYLNPFSDQLCGEIHVGYYSEEQGLFEDVNTEETTASEFISHWLPIPNTCEILEEFIKSYNH